ncbi:MAG: alkaline phosphatase [Candidatus Hydrogenedentes bacterium]|nr:alkaline phosphatase [Candidatus Hydrogenedentota bacterium]
MKFASRYCVVFLVLWAVSGAVHAEIRHIILFVGDGMGYNQVSAGSCYTTGREQGQLYWQYSHWPMSTYSGNNKEGYRPDLAWSDFSYVKKLPTDSAAAATTLSSGVKVRNGLIGMTPEGEPARHFIEDAEAAGWSTGAVTTVYYTHATPAAFTAHVKSRNKTEDIGIDMIRNTSVDVVIGAGHPWYDDDGVKSAEPSYGRVGGEALWKELVAGTAGGDADGDGIADPWTLVESRAGLQAIVEGPAPKRLLGVMPVGAAFQVNRGGDQKAAADVAPRLETSPTLTETVMAALKVLGQNPKGFFLMAEGGAIDWASHGNASGRMIEEQRDFDEAIAAVHAWVEAKSSWEETLVMITADHETGHLTGPGSDPEYKPLENRGQGQMPGMEWHSTQHTNHLVPFFAHGFGSDRFAAHVKGEDPKRGPYLDNTSVAQVMRELLLKP